MAPDATLTGGCNPKTRPKSSSESSSLNIPSPAMGALEAPALAGSSCPSGLSAGRMARLGAPFSETSSRLASARHGPCKARRGKPRCGEMRKKTWNARQGEVRNGKNRRGRVRRN